MPDELEERLQKHARSFDGLLSLIPAKLYYGEDVSDQWKRKKQTPEQKREAKKQKLDPDNWKSAKDVMDERAAVAKKRKREEDGDLSELEDIDLEKPKAERDDPNPKTKKQKTAQPETQVMQDETEEDKIRRKREARIAKRERKKEQKLKAKEKLERAKARKQTEKSGQIPAKSQPLVSSKQQTEKPKQSTSKQDEDSDEDMAEEVDIHQAANPLSTQLEDNMSTSEPSVIDPVEVFSPPQESGTSSISSIHLAAEEVAKPQAEYATTDPNQPPPRERLANAIAAFRTQRKADVDAAPKSRAELLEQRRRQEERRRAEKKEQKRREKEDAQRQQEAEIAARFSPGGSGSLLNSPRSPISAADASEPNNFAFGRIAFDDGSNFDPNVSLGGEGDDSEQRKKKKGPSDAATALSAALKKKSRLSGLDEEKQSRIASQDMWLAARKRAAGEKVKDDTSLLKKALKRQEGQKKKSEKEWTDRKEGIDKSIAARQKKRTENLAKRKEEKGSGGKKSKGKPKRPGFEGSFKGRTGGKKKGKA